MILVTGGRGFIGAHTVRALLDLGERCVLGQRAAGPPPALVSEREVRDGRAVVERMDCTDLGSVLAVGRRHRVTGIVHLAAAGMGASAPLDELSANAAGLFTVLRAAREWGAGRVVVASTIGVYAGVADPALREDAPLPVASPHPIPAGKKIAEVTADVAASSGLDVVAARIGAIWGPLGRPSSPFFAAPRLVHAAARHAAADGGASTSPAGEARATGEGGASDEAPPCYAGDAVDMCYARDCGRALALLQTTATLRHRTYNVGGGRAVANQEVAAAIGRAVPGAAPALLPGRSPGAPAVDARLDISRLREDTGYAAEYDLDRAVADYVGWLRAGNPR
ncbi:NAD(P)-dependent oxidoreductase [Microbispora sp. KK1-11]|uniref:NAD-dependent epimerase/dehydratase family protein n=1 Tax=Microbispora sp. KK1-11 TaxID=2053005 RepID=UPI00115B8680|nr:NAD(P)-dependent oxidoreductase [Microbispora sp. KK1-11]TQS29318.1 NAD(P)-dependent oxidoreductase [Microbispora sp. KK1-11]